MNRQSAGTLRPPSIQALVLASGSPRRKQLLELMGIEIEISPSCIDELPRPGETPPVFAQRAAREKALEVAARHPGRLVLGADTVVEIDESILGKPETEDHAKAMLRSLSGRDHMVHTGLALIAGGSCRGLLDTATVRFVELDEGIIEWYVGCGEPLDKAGAYAIQGRGGLLVENMRGSPHTVVGLPIHRLPELFAGHGLDFREWLAG
jgi:septum formation protein